MNVDDFTEFFQLLNGHPPFPWQTRLTRELCENGKWPETIDLPTGAGKTACLDIALFHLLVAASSGAPSAASRRIVFVVDRRIIVDEASERAQRIRDQIARAPSGRLAEARALLERLSGNGEESPLDVHVLRGGIPRENNLVRDPSRVAFVLSTVDQIGSRLLFRGYGVSGRMSPMHAGLFGFDTLLLLDEAHLSEPFIQTIRGISEAQKRASSGPTGVHGLRCAQLSATPGKDADFGLDEDDLRTPTLARRLQAHKPMRLLEVKKRDELPKLLAALVEEELAAPPLCTDEAPRIGIVLNRVASARDSFELLHKRFGAQADVHLLMGRIRPLDRDALMKQLGPQLKSNRARQAGGRPILVVATQTIEVGADFDFHTMFVEVASYPSVRQRVGRLNRLGLREHARGALICVHESAKDDPVYGDTIGATWDLLSSAGGTEVDLGIAYAPHGTTETRPTTPDTPYLTPAIVELLAQTNPRPAIEPDIANYLHGFVDQKADVTVAWRNGLRDDQNDKFSLDRVRRVLEALPILSLETMSLPLSTVRMWLSNAHKPAQRLPDPGDLEGDPTVDEALLSPREVVVIRNDRTAGASRVKLLDVRAIRPGDVIVLEASFDGGSDPHGFAPASRDPVDDQSLVARATMSRSSALVVTLDHVMQWFGGHDEAKRSVRSFLERMTSEEPDSRGLAAATWDWLESHLTGEDAPEQLREALDALRDNCRAELLEVEEDDSDLPAWGIALLARRPARADLFDAGIGLQRTVDVELHTHCRGVAEFAEHFASRVGLAPPLVSDLKLAGRLHDLGKADPRFQEMLGSDGTKLLAKGRTASRSARLGDRHEAYSVALCERHGELLQSAHDAELVLHLVGSHHGYGRALQPVMRDPGVALDLEVDGRKLELRGAPRLSDVDSGWCERFDLLQRRYGAWGLAYLETVLRLADHRRSEWELEYSTMTEEVES